MKRSFKAFLVAMLVAVPMLSSCADTPTSPEVSTTIERQDGLLGDLLGGVVDLVGGVVNLLGAVLTGPDANGSEASAWIGYEGGVVKTAAYTLTVPRGAVSTKTRFVVKPTNTGAYMVELDAYVNGLLGQVEVGSKGFKKPVLLTISYAQATGVTNEKKIAIVYVTSSSQGTLQPVTVDTRDNDVTAQLSHFSKYAMVQN
jgi:hypothetical protein